MTKTIKQKVEEKTGVISTPTQVKQEYFKEVRAGLFPLKFFEEWEADCKLNFGGRRWMKMWSDHLQSKQLEANRLMVAMASDEYEEVESSEEIPLMDGGIEDG